ncbi:MAG: hypothetical protein IOC72_10245, partial [Rhodobacter sp.]|nr:hypothetical protein [Rhodobacter sp.]
MRFARVFTLTGTLCAVILVAGCGARDLDEPPVDLGPFRLGLNVVVADNMQKVPISRDATVEEWETGLKKAVANRFGPSRYDGDRLYNIGINIDGYALAPPGIPVVAAPKSVVVVSANVWDDANHQRLNPEARQFTIFESLSGESVIGTGLTSTKTQQIDALSYNVAKALEGWFLDNPQWFDPAGAIPGDAPDLSTPPPQPRVVSGPSAGAAPVAISPAPLAATEPAAPVLRPLPRPPG